jgi:hypothetical protein
MNRNIKIASIAVIIGGVAFYFWRKDLVPVVRADNNFVAGLEIGEGDISTWYPMLPIHAPYKPEKTMGFYEHRAISTRYKEGITPARSTDYYNPSQLYASKGDPTSLRQGEGMAREAMKNEGLVG